jgi:hypothetical protein
LARCTDNAPTGSSLQAVERENGEYDESTRESADDKSFPRSRKRSLRSRYETCEAAIDGHAQVRLAQHQPATIVELSKPAAAALFVVMQILAIASGSVIVLPG